MKLNKNEYSKIEEIKKLIKQVKDTAIQEDVFYSTKGAGFMFFFLKQKGDTKNDEVLEFLDGENINELQGKADKNFIDWIKAICTQEKNLKSYTFMKLGVYTLVIMEKLKGISEICLN